MYMCTSYAPIYDFLCCASPANAVCVSAVVFSQVSSSTHPAVQVSPASHRRSGCVLWTSRGGSECSWSSAGAPCTVLFFTLPQSSRFWLQGAAEVCQGCWQHCGHSSELLPRGNVGGSCCPTEAAMELKYGLQLQVYTPDFSLLSTS